MCACTSRLTRNDLRKVNPEDVPTTKEWESWRNQYVNRNWENQWMPTGYYCNLPRIWVSRWVVLLATPCIPVIAAIHARYAFLYYRVRLGKCKPGAWCLILMRTTSVLRILPAWNGGLVVEFSLSWLSWGAYAICQTDGIYSPMDLGGTGATNLPCQFNA